MFRKLVSLSLVALLINLAVATPTYASSKAEKEARFAEKVKAKVLMFETGEAARVKIKLRNKTELKGYVSSTGDEGFAVTDSTGMATAVSYPQGKSVQGNNLSTGAKIAISLDWNAGSRVPNLIDKFGR